MRAFKDDVKVVVRFTAHSLVYPNYSTNNSAANLDALVHVAATGR